MLTIRDATKGDCLLLRSLAEEAFPATYRDILSSGQIEFMMDWMYSIESIEKQMDDGHEYFIAYVGGSPCGYVSIQQESQDLFHLQKIYVLPSAQGKHCGSALFRHAIDRIRSVHPSPCAMELNVNRRNPAVGFYERMGMRKVREGDFPIGGGFYMNDYIMRIDLG